WVPLLPPLPLPLVTAAVSSLLPEPPPPPQPAVSSTQESTSRRCIRSPRIAIAHSRRTQSAGGPHVRVCARGLVTGNPAVVAPLEALDPWLCVPAFRRVCPCHVQVLAKC